MSRAGTLRLAALLALVSALGGCGEALATASTVVTTLQQAQTVIDQTLGPPTPTPGASASPAPSASPSEVPTIFGIPFPGAVLAAIRAGGRLGA